MLAAAREAFVAGMQLSSAIAAGIGVALAVLTLLALRNQRPADPDGADEDDLRHGVRHQRRTARYCLAGAEDPPEEEVLLTPALGQETRRAALEGLMDLFEPGNIVDLANRFAGRFGPG